MVNAGVLPEYLTVSLMIGADALAERMPDVSRGGQVQIMRGPRFIAPLVLTAVFSFGGRASATGVGFESVPSGTTWGKGSGNSPGDVVLVEDDISMSVEEYTFRSFTSFVEASIGGRYPDAFPTQALELNNIGARFNFGNLDFAVGRVTVELRDFGGVSQFAVNGGKAYLLNPSAELPEFVAPGIHATVDGSSLILQGNGGFVGSLLIMGQELVIDNVMAIPEPATLALFATAFLPILLRRRRA